MKNAKRKNPKKRQRNKAENNNIKEEIKSNIIK